MSRQRSRSLDTSWTSGSISLTSSGGVLSGCTGLSAPKTGNPGVYNVAGCTFEGGYIYDPVSKTYAAIPYSLYASGTGVAPATSTSFTVDGAGPASQLVFSTEPNGSSSTSGTAPFATQPTVTVEDAFGNIVTNYNTAISMAFTTPTSESLSGCAAVTPTNGAATFTGCAGSSVGTNLSLTASSGTGSAKLTKTSTDFNITGLPQTLTFTVEPIAANSGDSLGQQPVLTITDSNGYVVTAATTPVTLWASGGSLTLCTGLTPVNGVITVATCTFAGTVGHAVHHDGSTRSVGDRYA